jgi:CRISPR-associated protein Csd1
MIVSATVRASNPMPLENKQGKTVEFRWIDWEKNLCATCALVKKYYLDKEKEDIKMSLEEERTDRDYLYGRLLAIADGLERYALWKQLTIQGREKDISRLTNAIRYMNRFSQRPFSTWKIIHEQLNPYLEQLRKSNSSDWYERELSLITSLFQSDEFEKDRSLSGTYLLGYYLERKKMDDRIKALKSDREQKNNDESKGDSKNES